LNGEQETPDIETVEKQLNETREQLTKASEQTAALAEKRDNLNEKFRTLRQEIRNTQVERDKLNEEVKLLKVQRNEAQNKVRTIVEQIKEHREKIAALKKKAPQGNHRGLQRELDGIEWKIQTTPYDVQEEKRLIDNVKQLEKQLVVYRKIDKQHEIINVSEAELKGIEIQRDISHQELTGAVGKSQELHASMLAKIKESKETKTEADATHAQFVLVKETLNPLRERLGLLIMQRRALIQLRRESIQRERSSASLLHEADQKNKKAKEQELKEKLGSQAKDKLARGEKLNWQEFQLLADDGEEQDSET
jgi:uncharacterized coiled-coil DUF342 family protein